MTYHGNGGPPLAYFAISKPQTGEVLAEMASLPPSFVQPSASTAEKNCGLFSEAFAFIEAAQTRSYDFFGRNMAKAAGAKSTVGAVAARGGRDQDVVAMMACDAPSSSFMDSAEWEGGDVESDGSDEAGGNDGGGEAVGMSAAPPAKRPRN
ncbi:hypothetical protein DQ04_03611020 [Trypanosoma grayi]|uniref:hypothetical protein n=1 Tax=Trypanosoma grayi TaxID=71804 RepID=UPI0004F44F7C|nr:hypothetical protein DQ04_03611020 [Trypanosoma grayi]KEG10527.1 hypothetical protein DQ04_03611020 [Trypanosoma grayi]